MTTPLQRARTQLRVSQSEISERTGINQSTYSRIERTGANCSPARAAKLVEAFRELGAKDITELHVLYPERYARRKRARS